MEPGASRETPTALGAPNPAGLREETPGEEAKGGARSTGTLKRRGVEGDTEEEETAQRKNDEDAGNQVKAGEEEDGVQHDEELDPRIQACYWKDLFKVCISLKIQFKLSLTHTVN